MLDYTGGQYDIVSWDPRGVGLSTSAGTLLPASTTHIVPL